ncbi:hypothetical protein VTN00DRAFT_3636 [Thermoascus crustaceus]|uniref:uncharacterized protein n=1 Tax=Thermoascus crustaceus TaxID=5088 RepID=UPI0037422506
MLREGGDPGPSSRAESHNRPLPSVSSSTCEEPRTPGSSNVNAIDLTSSSPPEPLPPEQSLNSPTLPRPQNNFVEYILPRWQPDSEVNRCPICGTQFSFWYRKHHCRKCGRVVCASCSPHRITIPRQFIVRPPEQDRRPASMFVQPSTAFSQIVSGDGSTQSLQQDEHYINPALGGGEEVRLCNPCVPDPNPDPPLGYGAVRSGIASPDWVSGRSALQLRQAMHRTHHSLSSAMFGSGREADRELRRQRGRGMITDTSEMNRGNRAGDPNDLSSYGGFAYTMVPNFQGLPPRYQSPRHSEHPPHSPPAYSSPRSFSGLSGSLASRAFGPYYRDHSEEGVGSSSTRPGRVRSLVEAERSRHASRFHRTRIDESDLCPICNRPLPPRGPDGNEEAREAHVRECIEGHSRGGRSSPNRGSPSSQPPLTTRMLAFTATEKDCVGQDGGAQECTICMEEYEVGEQLARLECLCKFHKACIVEWFERKKECPVHKVS